MIIFGTLSTQQQQEQLSICTDAAGKKEDKINFEPLAGNGNLRFMVSTGVNEYIWST